MNSTREVLQVVATHVVARARHAATGRFGLRCTPGGFGTPAFGDPVEVVRVAGTVLVREVGNELHAIGIDGASLVDLATVAGVDLDTPFDVGHDTPPLGDVHAPLRVDASDAATLAEWWLLGWRVLDAVSASARAPMTIQLWPEHFDAGTSVAVGDGENARCNLGASPGDSFSAEPYLYVGPWTSERPGDASYWNAGFGAALTRTEVMGAADPFAAAHSFMRRGLDFLSADRSG